jgi:hypothetical protein
MVTVTIFVSHLHVSKPTIMYIFGDILMLLSEHAISFAHINILILHTEVGHNILRLVQVFRHVMLRRDEINNQFDHILVALIQKVVPQFQHHEMCHRLKYSHIGAIMHFFICGIKEPIEMQTPPTILPALQILSHTLYQCQLLPHPYGPRPHFYPTLLTPLPLHGHAIPDSSA